MKSAPAAAPAKGHGRSLQRHGLRVAKAFVVVAWCGGCTSLLGIDGEYVSPSEAADAAAGSAPTGGDTSASGGSGGTTVETGGTSGATTGDGSVITGCTVGGTTCPSGQKCCPAASGDTTFCTAPEPNVGCSLDSCDRCPQPLANSTAVCNSSNQCDIHCNDGYIRAGNECRANATGTGGTTGQGGASAGTGGQTAAPCKASACPSSIGGGKGGCTIASPFGCCKSDNTCGCTWATTGSSSVYCL